MSNEILHKSLVTKLEVNTSDTLVENHLIQDTIIQKKF